MSIADTILAYVLGEASLDASSLVDIESNYVALPEKSQQPHYAVF